MHRTAQITKEAHTYPVLYACNSEDPTESCAMVQDYNFARCLHFQPISLNSCIFHLYIPVHMNLLIHCMEECSFVFVFEISSYYDSYHFTVWLLVNSVTRTSGLSQSTFPSLTDSELCPLILIPQSHQRLEYCSVQIFPKNLGFVKIV